ncbi:hypothetical protein F933_01755 [Acinetobacter beijerinckii CIP 110307]|uniref:Uncharacterized protein n=1 Tax=Acinetobacter beijerinckii CIP 110307 TaxID=1217648 RepID=N9EAM9_9GAMM|nr:hypothetical protein F933_01755 [Acinetobacter beijerinckii CIP 110307]
MDMRLLQRKNLSLIVYSTNRYLDKKPASAGFFMGFF